MTWTVCLFLYEAQFQQTWRNILSPNYLWISDFSPKMWETPCELDEGNRNPTPVLSISWTSAKFSRGYCTQKKQGLPLLLRRHVRKETATFYDPVMLVAEPVSWCQRCSALFLDHDEPQSGAFRCLAWSSSRAGTEELQKPFSSNQQVLWKFRCPQSFRSCMGMMALLRSFWIMARRNVHMNSWSPPVSPSLDVPEGYLRPAIRANPLFQSGPKSSR